PAPEKGVTPFRGSAATLIKILWWSAGTIWLRFTVHPTDTERAARVRSLLQELSGLWVKAGQLVSLRRDIFGDEFCAELAKLQDRTPAFSIEIVRRIVAEDLGRPLDQVFDAFDDSHVAAASIGQTHRAILRLEGKPVAVKV